MEMEWNMPLPSENSINLLNVSVKWTVCWGQYQCVIYSLWHVDLGNKRIGPNSFQGPLPLWLCTAKTSLVIPPHDHIPSLECLSSHVFFSFLSLRLLNYILHTLAEPKIFASCLLCCWRALWRSLAECLQLLSLPLPHPSPPPVTQTAAWVLLEPKSLCFWNN